MTMVKGVIHKVFSRPAGRGTAFSIKLDGDANYYGCGFKAPPVVDGQTVTFSANKNAKGYWDADVPSIQVVASEPVVATKGVGTLITKDDYWKRKEERDLLNDKQRNMGASANTALEFLELLGKIDAMPKLPTKQADRADAVFELVQHYAAKFRGEGITDTPAAVEQDAPAPAASGDWQ